MSPLTPYLETLAKTQYLDYRTFKSIKAGKKIKPAIQAGVSALSSAFATRAQVPIDQLMMPDTVSMEQKLRIQKMLQRTTNIDLAKKALNEFIQNGAGAELNEELNYLGDYIVSKTAPARFIKAPLKGMERAMEKTEEDYAFAYGRSRDLVRSTICCATDEGLKLVANLIRMTCIPKYGMGLVKDEGKVSTRDGGKEDSGYSDWNFNVQFSDHPAFAVEVQVNTTAVLYGKMSRSSFMKQMQVSEGDYATLQAATAFPGGLGHAFYEISRSGETTQEEQTWAKTLSLDYYDACRGVFRGQTTLQNLNSRIALASEGHTSAKAKDVWKHAVQASGWMLPISTS